MNTEVRKHLIFNTELCTGCRECEKACSLKHESLAPPEKSRIRMLSESEINFAIICQHCKDPVPCQKACHMGAIGKNDIFNAITISTSQCIGCKECLDACPFGAIFMDEEKEKAYKCDLCREKPECIKHCETGALTFGEATSDIEIDYRKSFKKFKSLKRKGENNGKS